MRGWGKIKKFGTGYMVGIYLGPERFRRVYPTKELASDTLKELRRKRALGDVGILGPGGRGPRYSDVLPKLQESYRSRELTPRTLGSYLGELKALGGWAGHRLAENADAPTGRVARLGRGGRAPPPPRPTQGQQRHQGGIWSRPVTGEDCPRWPSTLRGRRRP